MQHVEATPDGVMELIEAGGVFMVSGGQHAPRADRCPACRAVLTTGGLPPRRVHGLLLTRYPAAPGQVWLRTSCCGGLVRSTATHWMALAALLGPPSYTVGQQLAPKVTFGRAVR